MADKKFDKKGGKKSNDVSFGYLVSIPLILAILAFVPFIPKLLAGDHSAVRAWISNFLYIWRTVVAPIVIILDVLLLVGFIYVVVSLWPIRSKVSLAAIPGRKRKKKTAAKSPQLIKRWGVVLEKAAAGTPENLRLAIVEADTLVDAWLKRAGYRGNSFSERVAVIKSDQVRSFKAMWQAHLLRNNLVHTPGYSLGANTAKSALSAYEAFLKEMGAL
ncbi:MAG: hypothetical protein Q8O87_01755 [bacterium]|nr:hypothetical protein [bacterium]